MAFYQDVLVGQSFKPTAQRENDISHLLNAFNETNGGAISCGGKSPMVSVPVQIDGSYTQGVAVEICANTMSDDYYISGSSTITEGSDRWAVPLQSGSAGVVQCAISGLCFVRISTASTYTAGNSCVQIKEDGTFEYSGKGFPLYMQASTTTYLALADISRAVTHGDGSDVYWAVCQAGNPTQGLSADIYDEPNGNRIGDGMVYGEPMSTDVEIGAISLWVAKTSVKILQEN